MNQEDYGDQYNALATQYQPNVDLLNTQVAALPAQQQVQRSALDQAKTNAFRDITNSANAKGVLFSGVPIDQQAQYTGTKYLPAVANLETSFNNQKTSLLGKINDLNAARSRQAQGNIAAYQKAQSDAQYKQAQLALSAQRNQIAASRGGGGLTAYQQYQIGQKQASQYKLGFKDNNNGYWFTGPNNAPVSAYDYAKNTGNSLLDLLKNSRSSYDQNAYTYAAKMAQAGHSEDQILRNLRGNFSKLF